MGHHKKFKMNVRISNVWNGNCPIFHSRPVITIWWKICGKIALSRNSGQTERKRPVQEGVI